VVGLDPTRVTLNVRNTGRSGYEICNGLLDHGVIVEMATADVLLFLVSPSVTDSFVDSTVQALRAVLEDGRDAGRSGGTAEPSMPPALPDRVLTPRQAIAAPRERVPRRQAVGRVSGESIGCYPPVQAVFVPGERITEEAVDYLASVVEAGGHLKRVDDDHFLTIDVLRDPYLGG
jgi:arginine/lysine/ornithine decarboxylase